jgi:hypothetical protein
MAALITKSFVRNQAGLITDIKRDHGNGHERRSQYYTEHADRMLNAKIDKMSVTGAGKAFCFECRA